MSEGLFMNVVLVVSVGSSSRTSVPSFGRDEVGRLMNS